MSIIREMKEAGLSNTDIVLEFVGAISVFAVPLALYIVGAQYF